MAAVLALLAVVGMHVTETDAHACHLGSAAHPDGREVGDGHGRHEGSGPTSCTAIACVAIVLAVLGVAAGNRRRPRSVRPPLVTVVTAALRGPEPPVPRALLSI
jgi:hypothetical protein